MKERLVASPTSRLRLGISRADITPPVGIYHRMWGAARHDQATGVHQPLIGDVLVFEPLQPHGTASRMIRVQIDQVGLGQEAHEQLRYSISQAGAVALEQVIITYSHTHSGGFFTPDRVPLPGGDLIPAYLDELGATLQNACREAIEQVQEVTISYATGWCDMAANRDCWDEELNGYVCGYNPDGSTDNTVLVGRVTDHKNELKHVFVHYACHPTTLAWDNTLLSPDFVGALRQEVERYTGASCTYLQGPCGDIGAKDGHQGDTAVADRNGRQVALAALSAMTSMGDPSHDFQYQGPVISGATLGTWKYMPFSEDRVKQSTIYDGGMYTVDLPLIARPDPQELAQQQEQWLARQQEADQQGDAVAARDYGARAERARRWIGRLDSFPEGENYSLGFSIYRMGDALWVTCGGEPYNLLQTELRRRFPAWTLIVSPLDTGLQVAYLLPEDRYGKGLYQEEPSPLAQGCLEGLLEAITEQIERIVK
jgi:hypothetical protein